MIVRGQEDDFILIQQHDHAHLSGDIDVHMNKDLFMDTNREEVVTAAISVSKANIKEIGLEKACEIAEWQEQEVIFTP